MARIQLHLGFLFSSPISQRASVDVTEGEESESESECSEDVISSSLITPAKKKDTRIGMARRRHHISKLAMATAALRRSLAMCRFGGSEDGFSTSTDIGCPTDVQHVSHVTFDRFDGFLGLPEEFQLHIPSKVPSASVSIFGVSAKSMKCSHDSRGNSVPTILLSMQRHLYSQGGLKEEGIFRINADSGQEMLAREQLNKGIVPHIVDLHCLAGLIKAWFRELPSGILDSLAPEEVMHCNRRGDCSQLVGTLPPTEAALLHWAVNLMADVVEHEHHNKMNSRNIAMVFAPNLTQKSDPLIALIHVVQLMNFLNALVMKTLRERAQAAAEALQSHSGFLDFSNISDSSFRGVDGEASSFDAASNTTPSGDLFGAADASGSDTDDSFRSFERRIEDVEVDDSEFISGRASPITSDRSDSEIGHGEGLLNMLNLRKGVQKLCRHPAIFLNRSRKMAGEADIARKCCVSE